MTKSVGVHEAKTHLSRFLDDVAAGEDVLITRRGEPAARLVVVRRQGRWEFGIDRGRLVVPDDFDVPLDADVLEAFESLRVRLLLDTHVFLWLLASPERVGEHLASMEDAANDLLLSAASSWEIAIKVGLGRLELPDIPARYVSDRMRAIGVEPLAVEHSDALAVAELPMLHRDPFDRILVAQARHLGLTLVTANDEITRYDVRTIRV